MSTVLKRGTIIECGFCDHVGPAGKASRGTDKREPFELEAGDEGDRFEMYAQCPDCGAVYGFGHGANRWRVAVTFPHSRRGYLADRCF